MSATNEALDGEKEISFGPLHDLLGYWVRRLHTHLSTSAAVLVEGEGLRSHQLTTLSLIVDNPEISQSELARALGIKPSNIVPLVDELEQRGLVIRNAAANTRRKYALVATRQGRAKRDQALTKMSDQEDALLDMLTPVERAELLDLIRKVSPE